MEIAIGIFVCALIVLPFIASFIGYDETVVAVIGTASCFIILFIGLALGVGTLAAVRTNTNYTVERVVEIRDGQALLYMSNEKWRNDYHHRLDCSELRDGCPDAKDWPKKFKLVSDGEKSVIVELKSGN